MRSVIFILAALCLAACAPGQGTPTSQVAVSPASQASSGGSLRQTEDLPAAPVVPVPTRLARRTGTQAVPRLPATATPGPTRTPSPSSTRPPSITPTPAPEINLLIAACDTGIDLFNWLGEVTNAYVRVQNVGEIDINQVQITLEGSDEEQIHPDKSYRLDHLPAGYEIALKLTVDTKNGEDTALRVTLTGEGDLSVFAIKDSCRSRRPDQNLLEKLGVLFQMHKIAEEQP
jgi:hypothetical protein